MPNFVLVDLDTEGAEVVVVRTLRGAGLLSRVANLVVELQDMR